MGRFLHLLSCAIVLTFVAASPTCTHKNRGSSQCVSKCRAKFGWPGYQMGTDPWGAIAQPSAGDISSALSDACSESSTQGPLAGAAASGPTQPAMAVPSPQTETSTAVSSSMTPPPPPPSTPVAPSSSSEVSSSRSAKPTTSSVNINQAAAKPPPPPASSSALPPPPPASTTSAAPPPPPPPPPSKAPPPPPSPSPKPSPKPSPAPAPAPPSGSSGSTSGSDISAYLSAHNTVRAQHGASALTWSDNLASKAQQWANGCVFQHSGGSLGPFGENLAAGTGDSYDIAAAVKSWTDEVSQYDPNNPVPSHFTQVVWKASTQVGCAEALCDGIFDPSFGKAKFFVCEYSPQGNVIGQFGQNVQV